MERYVDMLIADDHSMVRNGLKLMLHQQNYFIPNVTEASDGTEVISLFEQHDFEVILLDISMPKMDGISVIRKLKSKDPTVRILALTMHKEENIIKQALDAGALGYILKSSGLEELVKAIMTVKRGERYFSNEVAQILFEEHKARKTVSGVMMNLSKRELQILGMIVKEYTNQQIADELNISRRTIEGHRVSLMKKLNVKSSVGLVKFALKNGME
ncbi:MAG: response regulator transcription factor [Bacteroidetes bacterium]|nr:MAG: response regulator transcription factor [Bacteroidota bacterium]